MMKINKYFLLMYFGFFVYSLSGVLSKLASKYLFFSMKYLFCLMIMFFILAIYASLWQIVLKHISLSIAIPNRICEMFFGFLWAVLFFNESLQLKTIIGIFVVCIGIFIINVSEKK